MKHIFVLSPRSCFTNTFSWCLCTLVSSIKEGTFTQRVIGFEDATGATIWGNGGQRLDKLWLI